MYTYISLVSMGFVTLVYVGTMIYNLGYNLGRKDEKDFQEWKEEYNRTRR